MTSNSHSTGRQSHSTGSSTANRRQEGGSAGEAERDRLRESLLRDSLLIVNIAGMHSHACSDRIVEALGELPGVTETEVDFASGQASVIFDNRRVTVHQVLEAIVGAGYVCEDYTLGSGGGGM